MSDPTHDEEGGLVIDVHSMAHGGDGVGHEVGATGEASPDIEGPASPDAVSADEGTHGAQTAEPARGRTWFVRGGLPGERVAVEPEREAKRWSRGVVTQVVRPSPHRVTPPCPLATRCGGCSWQHVDPAAQAQLKRDVVADQLRALLPDRDRVELDRPGAPALGYRRRARVHWERAADGSLSLGFYAAGTHEVVDAQHCPVLDPALDHALSRLRAAASVLPDRGEVHGLSDGQQAVLGLPGVRPDDPVLQGLQAVLDERLVGIAMRGGRRSGAVGRIVLSVDEDPEREVPGVRTGPFDFAQAAQGANVRLVRYVADQARRADASVLELFCGGGNLTRALARTARRVRAVDEDREAIGRLERAAKHFGWPVSAKRAAAAKTLSRALSRDEGYDVVVLDPPRRGLGEAATADLARVAQAKIVYVSCDPATLARDLGVLTKAGWALRAVRVFDLMPMTPQVETVATLVRRQGKGR